jgi:hypothetical protein
MSVIASTHTVVNRSRKTTPFAAGILPEPTLESFHEPLTTGMGWERDVRRCLFGLRYPACNITAAVAWIVSRGKVDLCPVVDREDWSTVNALVGRKPLPAPAVEKALGVKLLPKPAPVVNLSKPLPTPAPFEPSPSDRLWWAFIADEPTAAEDRHFDDRWTEEPRDFEPQWCEQEECRRGSLVGHPA